MDSWKLKLDRAKEHLEAFERETNEWIEAKPYSVIDERNPNPALNTAGDLLAHHRRVRLESIDPVPARSSVLVGDCLFNMRSALEHLAMSLAQSFTLDMTDQQTRNSEFPISLSSMSPREETRKIGCIAPAARTIIKELQPHHREQNPGAHPLWQLHDLNIIDKHRELNFCTSIPMARDHTGVGKRAIGFTGNEDYVRITKWLRYWKARDVVELTPQAVLLEYGFLINDADADPKKEVCLKPLLPIEIAFGDTGPASLQSVVPTLKAILDFVDNDVVSPLSRFL